MYLFKLQRHTAVCPEEILNFIACKCRTDCSKRLCSCGVAGLMCTTACDCDEEKCVQRDNDISVWAIKKNSTVNLLDWWNDIMLEVPRSTYEWMIILSNLGIFLTKTGRKDIELNETQCMDSMQFLLNWLKFVIFLWHKFLLLSLCIIFNFL